MRINLQTKAVLFFIILISLIIPVFAASQYKDMGEISEVIKTEQVSLRTFEGIRLRYLDEVATITIDSLQNDSVSLLMKSMAYGDEVFSLSQYERKTFDLDDDTMVDFSIMLDNITISSTKRRIGVTFSSDDSMALPTIYSTNNIPSEQIKEVKTEPVQYEDNIDSGEEQTDEQKTEPIVTVIDDFEVMDTENDEILSDSDKSEKKISSTTFSIIIWLGVLIVIGLMVFLFFIFHKKKYELYY